MLKVKVASTWIGIMLLSTSCVPGPMGTKGELMTVHVENIAKEDGGYVAKLSASTPSIVRPITDFKAEAEFGFNKEGSSYTKQIQIPKDIVEKAFNHPENFKVKLNKDGFEIESRDSNGITTSNAKDNSSTNIQSNIDKKIKNDSGSSKKLIYEFNLSKKGWENPWMEGGGKATFNYNNSQLKIDINESNGKFYGIQLFQYGLNIEKDAAYLMDFDITSNKKCYMLTKLHIYPPDIKMQDPEFATFQLAPGSNRVSSQFQSLDGSNSTRLTLYFGQMEKGTELTINNLRLYRISN